MIGDEGCWRDFERTEYHPRYDGPHRSRRLHPGSQLHPENAGAQRRSEDGLRDVPALRLEQRELLSRSRPVGGGYGAEPISGIGADRGNRQGGPCRDHPTRPGKDESLQDQIRSEATETEILMSIYRHLDVGQSTSRCQPADMIYNNMRLENTQD